VSRRLIQAAEAMLRAAEYCIEEDVLMQMLLDAQIALRAALEEEKQRGGEI